jgi:hypothetical protein
MLFGMESRNSVAGFCTSGPGAFLSSKRTGVGGDEAKRL